MFGGWWNGGFSSGHDNFVEGRNGNVGCGVDIVVGRRVDVWKYGGNGIGNLVLVGFTDIRVGDKLVPIGARRWGIAALGGVV